MTPPDTLPRLQMRDPYPFNWVGRRFALLGAGMSDGTPAVLLFSCDDPRAWRYKGVWLSGEDPVTARVAPAVIWECPALATFEDTVVLVLSLWQDDGRGDVVHLWGRCGTTVVCPPSPTRAACSTTARTSTPRRWSTTVARIR